MDVIEIINVSKSFSRLKAVDNVTLRLKYGQTLALVGGSGCGKTTLARMVAGLIKPDAGKIKSVDGVQMVFQDPFNSFDPMYPVDVSLREAFIRRKDVPVSQQRELIASMIQRVGLEPASMKRYPHEFSGGQRQRLAIARTLLTGSRTVVLDEVTSALDVLVARQILELLNQLKDEMGLTYLFISHNLRVVRNFADKIAVMQDGSIIEYDDAKRVIDAPRHAHVKALIKAAFDYAA